MRLLSLALALALVLVCTASARAGWRIDRAKQLASTVWNHPCADQGIKVEWPSEIPDGWLDAVGAVDEATPCTIFLSPHRRYPWPVLCTVVLHETGHLAGFRDPTNHNDPDHSSNPDSVMYETFRDPEIHHTAGRDVIVWDADPRCAHRGRPFLERHRLL